MPGATPIYGWPFATPTDYVTNAPGAIEDLATALDADLAPAHFWASRDATELVGLGDYTLQLGTTGMSSEFTVAGNTFVYAGPPRWFWIAVEGQLGGVDPVLLADAYLSCEVDTGSGFGELCRASVLCSNGRWTVSAGAPFVLPTGTVIRLRAGSTSADQQVSRPRIRALAMGPRL